MLGAALLSACLLGATDARACFPTQNATLLGHIPLVGFPSSPGGGNDCWGYVSPSGREYALMGVRNAVVVVDITDPAGLNIVASIPHTDSNWCDIKTYGTYAYAVNESGGGLDVIDLSQVDSGVVTLVQRVTDDGLSTCHNIAVDEDSGYLYLCASNINEGRFVALDLSDPADPTIVGNFPIATGGVVHDAQIVTYTSGPYAGHEIAFCSSGTDGVEIYDVTDKTAMFELVEFDYPNRVFTHQCWLSDNRQYLYINDELDNINETVIYNVSDPANPAFVGTYSSGVAATDHNVFYHQGRIYEAEYRAGMRIFDASDPKNPMQIGWIDTFPADDAPGSGGAWGVYPFFPSGKVLVSDKNGGLFVVWPDAPPIMFDAPGGLPDNVDPDGGGFTVTISPAAGHAIEPSSATLVYDAGNGSVEVPLNDLGGGSFEVSFGPVDCGSIVQYYLRAATTSGVGVRWPEGAPCAEFSAVAAAEAVIGFSDEFESASNWTAGVAGDTATNGIWTRVDPIGTDAQPGIDHTPDPGSVCFVTGQGPPGGTIGIEDVDNGTTTLLSPSFDLSGFERATVSYWRWFHNSYSISDADEGNGPNEDVFVIEISDDDGQTWTTVETVGPDGPETAGGWFLHAFNVGDFVNLTGSVRLRFIASDLNAFSIVEAAVDDVRVYSIDCTGCPADLNGSGAVDVFDLFALLNAWGGTGVPEDLNSDGTVDVFDLFDMLAAWGSCP